MKIGSNCVKNLLDNKTNLKRKKKKEIVKKERRRISKY